MKDKKIKVADNSMVYFDDKVLGIDGENLQGKIIFYFENFKNGVAWLEFEKEDEAYCIMTSAPDHLYMTNDFIVTHNSQYAIRTGISSILDGYATSMMLCTITEDGSKISARPSGTEPKIKFYIGCKGNTVEQAENIINNIERYIERAIKTI